ncbi:MAG: dihydropteroate synthase [Bacteroidales bacterium]|nr:dihydropteroate synthase [Bacteroidales bacterium]
METGQVKLMGVVNVNDDSFFAESRAVGEADFIRRVGQLKERGIRLIDLGAVSSRPGAAYVGEEEEWRRLEPALEVWKREFSDLELSVDTFRSGIVKRVYDRVGRFLVNDISAGAEDPNMLGTVSFLDLPYVAMHRRGDFTTMHNDWHYDDVVEEVLAYFRTFAAQADALDIDWILDPGIGFSRSSEESLTLLQNLSRFRDEFHRPILVGVADKRITKVVPQDELHRLAVQGGATMLRVH